MIQKVLEKTTELNHVFVWYLLKSKISMKSTTPADWFKWVGFFSFFFCLQKLINPHPAGHGGPCSVWERILSKKREEIETNLETVGLGFWQSQAKYWFLILSSDFCKKFLKTQNTTTNSKKGIKKLKHFKYTKNKLHLITTNTNLIEFVRK